MRKSLVLVAQLVAAGELPVCPDGRQRNADSIKEKGGSIDRVAVEPLAGRPRAIALAKNAPHPHAALLFADFVLSPEGRKLWPAWAAIRQAGRGRRCSIGINT